LASKLNISLELLEETLTICQAQGRISENSTGIEILKFGYYQDREQQLPERKDAEKKAYDPNAGLTAEQIAKQTRLDSQLPEEELAQLPIVRRRAARAYLIDHPIKGKGR